MDFPDGLYLGIVLETDSDGDDTIYVRLDGHGWWHWPLDITHRHPDAPAEGQRVLVRLTSLRAAVVGVLL